jgi:hypothetical protein
MKRVDRSILALGLAVVGVAGILGLAVLRDQVQGDANPSASLTPSASTGDMQMGLAHIPTTNSCLLCHLSGGEAGLKPIPAIGHPLEGWRSCKVCHTDEKLGRTAPGHQGIAETECTNCHKTAPEGPAITQAHSQLSKPCLDCHGSVAHLPSSMVGRNQDECWLCHKPAPEEPPQFQHAYDPDLTCRSCHRSEQVGGLPIDHALRADDTCILCHDLQLSNPSPGASPLPTLEPSAVPASSPSPSPAPQG